MRFLNLGFNVFKLVLIYSIQVSLSGFQFSFIFAYKDRKKIMHIIYLDMMRTNDPIIHQNERSKQIIILPPSPKSVNDNKRSNIILINPSPKIQHANAMFDPNNASPASEFMNLLKLRMSVYFEQEINLFN